MFVTRNNAKKKLVSFVNNQRYSNEQANEQTTNNSFPHLTATKKVSFNNSSNLLRDFSL